MSLTGGQVASGLLLVVAGLWLLLQTVVGGLAGRLLGLGGGSTGGSSGSSVGSSVSTAVTKALTTTPGATGVTTSPGAGLGPGTLSYTPTVGPDKGRRITTRVLNN